MSSIIYPLLKNQRFVTPSWVDEGVLYEVNIRQYTPEGTFLAFDRHLERLSDLGITILWLMPIFPIGKERRKGSLGSYYSVADYTAVNPEFGTLDDLKSLVHHAHSLGMHVILDWVANHTARDNRWIAEHPSWYEWDNELNEPKTPWDWSDTAKLDYGNEEMRAAMTDSLLYWLREVSVDGFRFDMAMLVPDDFWFDALDKLQQFNPDIFLLAEAEGENFHRLGFHATYGWTIHHMMVDMASGRKNAWDLVSRIKDEAMEYPKEAVRMRFTSNHDEDSHQGSSTERFGSSLQASAVLSFILPGIPLIYSGEEAGNAKRLSFFDKDEIKWKSSYMEILYKELTTLRRCYAALQIGDLMTVDSSSSSPFLLSFKRKSAGSTVIALFNFTAEPMWTRFYDEDFEGEYHQIGTSDIATLHSDSDFYLAPWGWFVYFRRK